MKYYGPRELTDENGDPTGTYHYTKRRKSRITPLGYCAGEPMTTKEEYERRMGPNAPDSWDPDECGRAEEAHRTLRVNRGLVDEFGEKYHTDGHETKQDAIDCYTEYCIDTTLAFYDDELTPRLRQYGCDPSVLSEPVEGADVPPGIEGKACRHGSCSTVVAAPTAIIRVAGQPDRMRLCSDHCNREAVESFWTAPTNVMSSL